MFKCSTPVATSLSPNTRVYKSPIPVNAQKVKDVNLAKKNMLRLQTWFYENLTTVRDEDGASSTTNDVDNEGLK